MKTYPRPLGIQAIIALQAVAKVVEPYSTAAKAWDKMSLVQQATTMSAHCVICCGFDFIKNPVPLMLFGKDHWSLLAYVETCAVEQEPLDKRRLRCNEHTHHLHAVNFNVGSSMAWKPEYGTRLTGFFTAKDSHKPQLQIPNHDDWDCLNDLEAAGFIDVISEATAAVCMTDDGNRVVAALRKYKTSGGQFDTFILTDAPIDYINNWLAANINV
jgi:hypothetical protein